MVNPIRRMRKLQESLTAIRIGPGAAILPKEVKKIEMVFSTKINGGHMGPRKFWRHELKRLKYHNPGVPMTVNRTEDDAESPAVMSIHFASASSSSNATATADGAAETTVEQINMKNYTNSEILDALMKLTKAQPVEPTQEDQELVQRLEEQRIRSEKEKALSAQVRAKAKREKELLEQARGEVAAAEAA